MIEVRKMEYLYYDRLSDMLTLESDERGVEFLGPMTHALLKLQEYGYTPSQAREAVLRARFNMGQAVEMDNVKRIANRTSA